MQKPSVPKGTRDFSPLVVVRRKYIFNTIEGVFKKYGFKPIETPSMENLSTLTGKYGDEGDTLLFKVLNSGHWIDKLTDEDWTNRNVNNNIVSFTQKISGKGLRYDLTVPFARYVVMHQNDITFPFRRYQMQPVWRADRPQRGRYREFYQCDADIIGSNSLLNEADLAMIYAEAFELLGINATIKINNRKILSGIAKKLGFEDNFTDFAIQLDKLDKIVADWNNIDYSVFQMIGINHDKFEEARKIFDFNRTHSETLSFLKEYLDEEGKKGIEELESIFSYLQAVNFDFTKLKIDLTLARGLNYYTGSIFEVTANDVAMGSIGGGGRYDDLTGIFGLKGVSGVGISFGADRIYDVMEELNLFPTQQEAFTQLLFCGMNDEAIIFAMPLAAKARQAGINTEIYPSAAKLKKQLDFANANQIPYAVIIGESEMQSGLLSIKNLTTGEQQNLTIEAIIALLNN